MQSVTSRGLNRRRATLANRRFAFCIVVGPIRRDDRGADMDDEQWEFGRASGTEDAHQIETRILHGLASYLPVEIHGDCARICHRRSLTTGEVLVEDGDEPTHIGHLLSGMLGMVKVLPDGRRHIIGLLLPPDMYGRLYDGPSDYRIEALAHSEILTCEREDFEALLRKAPELERKLVVELLDELDAAREWLLVLGGRQVVQRVAGFLLILCRRKLRGIVPGALEAFPPVNLKLTIRRRDLAHLLGVRPESFSRAFRRLERDGIIRINNPFDFDVIDLVGLVDIAGHELVLDREPSAHRNQAGRAKGRGA